MDSQQSSRWKRWTVAGILFLVFCMAGYFSGFRLGLSDAVDAQVESRLAERKLVIYPVSYRIPTAIATSAAKSLPPESTTGRQSPNPQSEAAKPTLAEDAAFQMASLVAGVRQVIGPQHWSESGGPCSLGTMKLSTLVVSGSSDIHEQVAAFISGWQHGKFPAKPTTAEN